MYRKKMRRQEDEDEEDEDNKPVLAGILVPEPVFFCSIEPPSLAAQKALDNALSCLTREDPSLMVIKCNCFIHINCVIYKH